MFEFILQFKLPLIMMHTSIFDMSIQISLLTIVEPNKQKVLKVCCPVPSYHLDTLLCSVVYRMVPSYVGCHSLLFIN